VHLGQTDLPPAAAREILGENAIIGLSTHNIEQAAAALEQPIDYIAIGPIFATATKENPEDFLGLDKLKFVRATVKDFPLVAIGGITTQNAPLVLEAGANSLAIISALFQEKNKILDSMQQFLAS
jgi:thiamine-phosphate pyrophosphorylase